MLRFAVSIAVICGFLWVLPATAEPVFVPGSQVGLVPPPGFIPSDTFKGFSSPQESGSILIAELPAQAYDQVSGVSDAMWATKGITVQSRTVLSIDGARAVLIKGRQNYSGIALKKWMMIIGFDDLTAMVTAQIPATVAKERQAAIESSLGTIQLRAALSLDQKLAALPFSIGATDTMRVTNVLAGNTILLTRGPKNIVEGAEQPMLIIARSFPRALAEGATAEKVSRHSIGNIASLGDIAIERTTAICGSSACPARQPVRPNSPPSEKSATASRQSDDRVTRRYFLATIPDLDIHGTADVPVVKHGLDLSA